MLHTYLLIFGAIVLAAGVQGFLAGSTVSLIAAGILGACLLVAAFLLGSNHTVALVLALIGCLGIAGRFVPTFLKAGDKMAALWPAGILAVLGIVGLVMVVQAFLKR
jgi:uncharacterized membrane protein (UPF0136 family)